MLNPAPSFTDFQLRDLITIAILIVQCVAIYYGPIRAVRVARDADNRANRLREKGEIFAALMKTRQFRLDRDHVTALNLVQVHFHDDQKILAAYKAYIRLMKPEHNDLVSDRNDAFLDLLYSIAKSLEYTEDKKDVADLGYSPQGWIDDQNTMRKLHTLLVELLENKRPLGISNFAPPGQNAPHNPFPPSP